MVYPKQVKMKDIHKLKKQGLTLREIGDKLGVSHNAIWKRLNPDKVKGSKVDKVESDELSNANSNNVKVDKVDKELIEETQHYIKKAFGPGKQGAYGKVIVKLALALGIKVEKEYVEKIS